MNTGKSSLDVILEALNVGKLPAKSKKAPRRATKLVLKKVKRGGNQRGPKA